MADIRREAQTQRRRGAQRDHAADPGSWAPSPQGPDDKHWCLKAPSPGLRCGSPALRSPGTSLWSNGQALGAGETAATR